MRFTANLISQIVTDWIPGSNHGLAKCKTDTSLNFLSPIFSLLAQCDIRLATVTVICWDFSFSVEVTKERQLRTLSKTLISLKIPRHSIRNFVRHDNDFGSGPWRVNFLFFFFVDFFVLVFAFSLLNFFLNLFLFFSFFGVDRRLPITIILFFTTRCRFLWQTVNFGRKKRNFNQSKRELVSIPIFPRAPLSSCVTYPIVWQAAGTTTKMAEGLKVLFCSAFREE